MEVTISEPRASSTEDRPLTGLKAEQRLHSLVLNLSLDKEVLDYLLPGGRPHDYETSLWDYKRHLPNTSGRGDAEEQREAALAIAELAKDVVAFHNSYGGYIVAGIDQHAEEPIRGCENLNAVGFTVEKLNEQLKSYTKARIDCRFARVKVATASGDREVGLLVVPMRDANASVVRMARGAPESKKKKMSFEKGAIFARIGDSCVPLSDNAQMLQFLCSARVLGAPPRQLQHNLPPPDPNVIRFVGRGEYLFKLWNWLIDRHTAVKTLTALGGTGKTAIAQEFCRQFIEDAPGWANKLVWLSAKRRTFSAILGRYENATRTDFSTPIDFLQALAREMGAMDADLADAGDEQGELLDLVFDQLKGLPSLVVVDDIDTMPAEEQNNLFSVIQQLAGRLHDTGTRFLFTSRLELGADSQRIPVKGFDEREFTEYAKMVAKERSIALNDAVIKQMHRVSKGSPIFCSSIIRLSMLGIDIHQALRAWRGKDGEDVRRFAFEREMRDLSDSATRTLFALCTLGETTQLELKQVLEVDEHALNRDLARLRELHLYASGGDPRTGARLEVPEPIILMADILAEKVHDPKRLIAECARLRSRSPRVNDRVAVAIGAVVALWKEDDYEGAELTARQAVADNRKSGDLHCLLGQCLFKLTPPRAEEADKTFKEARRLQCTRAELLPTWMEAKAIIRDWSGIVDVVGKSLPRDVRSHVAFRHALALSELGRQAVERRDFTKAVERFKGAMVAASKTIGQGRAGESLAELRDLCRDCAHNYVSIVDANRPRPGDRLDVFNAVDDAFECHVTETRMIGIGLEALKTWAADALSRAAGDPGPIDILERRIERLDAMSSHLERQGGNRAEIAWRIRDVHDALAARLESARRGGGARR